VKLCARQFRSELTPETAADILLLADRHGLTQLKREVTAMVIAERSKYLENPDFKLKMKKNPDLLIEMFSGKLFSKP